MNFSLKSGAAFLLLAAVFFPGCGLKPDAEKNAPAQKTAASPAKPQTPSPQPEKPSGAVYFNGLLDRAATDESYFIGVCRLLLTRSVLLPLDSVPAERKGEPPQKISIKVFKRTEDSGPGTALVFSGKQALAQAGEKLQWTRNEKGEFPFAAIKGPDAFRVLLANGYRKVILDAAYKSPLELKEPALKSLADGKIPDFPTAQK